MLLTLIKEYIPLIILGFNVALFVIVKFNDLAHLDKRMTELINKFDSLEKKLDTTTERIATIEGRCSVNHSKT